MIADFSSSQMISWQTFWAEEKKKERKKSLASVPSFPLVRVLRHRPGIS